MDREDICPVEKERVSCYHQGKKVKAGRREREKMTREEGSNPTLAYYQAHAESYAALTKDADMSPARDRFAALVAPGGKILDLGCGSGRDALAFLREGFQVSAADGSEEMCRQARALTGLPVRCMEFSELSEKETYDGIWACASILHLPKEELSEVIAKIAEALRPGGIFYTCFKHGTGEELRGGRYYTDFTPEGLREFVASEKGLRVREIWMSEDVLPGREPVRWVNLLAEKAEGAR